MKLFSEKKGKKHKNGTYSTLKLSHVSIFKLTHYTTQRVDCVQGYSKIKFFQKLVGIIVCYFCGALKWDSMKKCVHVDLYAVYMLQCDISQPIIPPTYCKFDENEGLD